MPKLNPAEEFNETARRLREEAEKLARRQRELLQRMTSPNQQIATHPEALKKAREPNKPGRATPRPRR